MSEIAEVQTETPAAPPKQKGRRKSTRAAAPKAPKPPKAPSEFAGITATKCPEACTSERCVISTVNVCKHPLMCAITGCGPITLANRAKALKLIKRQKVEAGG